MAVAIQHIQVPIQQRVYQTKVQNVNDLKWRLINVWADMQQSVNDDAID